jgi:ABC-2 type transport system permease protein
MLYLNRLVLKQHLRLVGDWWTAVVGMIIEQATALAFLGIIFYRIEVIHGWSLHDMIFLLGLFVLSKPVYRIFFEGSSHVSTLVLEGDLDQYLVRPTSPLVLVATSMTNPVAAGDLLLGTVLVALAIPHIGVEWTLLRVVYLLSVVICGSMVYVGTQLLKGVVSVFLIRIDAINALLQEVQQYAKFPLSIYHPIVRVALISVLPYALATSVPAAAFLGKGEITSLAWFAPLACLGYALFAGLIFQWSLRFYKSTGS